MNAETERYYTTCYDNELKAISHYRQFPRMMPFIGKNYGELYPRIFLIGESHYLPREAQIHLDADKWYASKEEDVEKEQLQWQSDHPQNTTPHWLGWISTRGILNPAGIKGPYDLSKHDSRHDRSRNERYRYAFLSLRIHECLSTALPELVKALMTERLTDKKPRRLSRPLFELSGLNTLSSYQGRQHEPFILT